MQLASQAREIRVERRGWLEEHADVRTVAAAEASREWLARLVAVAARDSRRRPDSPCAVACGACREQLRVDIAFTAAGKRPSFSLHLREGLAFLSAEGATRHETTTAAWSLADSLGAVLALVQEGLAHDAVTQAWRPPARPPAPLDPDSADYRGDHVLLTGIPEPQNRVAPQYPKLARAMRVSGLVKMRALVAADGSVARVRVVQSPPHLDQAALQALLRWRFSPATCAGHPVPAWVTLPVRFSLH